MTNDKQYFKDRPVHGDGLLETEYDPFVDVFSSLMGDLGLPVEYVDDWVLYHMQTGEVHCGSNDKRSIPSNLWWQ